MLRNPDFSPTVKQLEKGLKDEVRFIREAFDKYLHNIKSMLLDTMLKNEAEGEDYIYDGSQDYVDNTLDDWDDESNNN